MTINFKDWKKNIEESVSKADVPAYLRKKKGEEPLTMADVKAPRKDSISAPANLAKARNEELKGSQHKLDKNKNGKLDSHDFKLLRKEESELSESVGSIAQAHGFKSGSGIHKGSYVHPKTGHTITPLQGGKQFGHSAESGKTIASFKSSSDLEGHLAKHGYKKSTNEEVELDEACGDKKQMKEAEMTDADMKQREKNVKGMKKNYKDFVAKYGDRAKDVMYATATKMAMKEAASVDDGEGEDEESKESIADKRADKKVAKDGRKYSGKIKFNDGEEDGNRVVEDVDFDLNEEITYYMEAMIDYSDFQAKIDAHKKAGNKVVDYKHTSEKAHITTIDKEGTKRKVTYKPSGVSMENMGKHEGDDADTEGNKVKKGDNAPAVKRGRGRPAGAKSGARQTGAAKKEYGGLAFHSLNLPNRK